MAKKQIENIKNIENKENIENIKTKIMKEKEKKIKSCDMIVPAHFIDWKYFSSNVKSWMKEIPIKTLYFGCNNPDEEYIMGLKEFLSQYKKIKFIDQRGIKTLGMQIVDLMKRVNTEFFVYCHVDAKPTRHSFLVLEADMFDVGDENNNENNDHEFNRLVGIVESDRIQYPYINAKEYPEVYPYYYYRPRSFSGYQLIRKEALNNFFEKVEDDYIYRNEDIIFQNVCKNNGFRYIKSHGLHIHTCSNTNHKWTPQGEALSKLEARKLTFEMQVKGIVKYTTPDDLTKAAWKSGFGSCVKESDLKIKDFLEDFVKKTNPEWIEAIWDIINELLQWTYR